MILRPLAGSLLAAGLDPAGARATWHTAKTADGLTPAAFAALACPKSAALGAAMAGRRDDAARAAAATALAMPQGGLHVAEDAKAEEAAGPRSVLLGPAGSHDTSQTSGCEELEAAAQAAAALAAAASPSSSPVAAVLPAAPESSSGAAQVDGHLAAAAGQPAEDGGTASESESPAGSRMSLASTSPVSHGSTASLSCPSTPQGYSTRRASVDGASTGASTPQRHKEGASPTCRASPRRLAKLLGACVVSLRK